MSTSLNQQIDRLQELYKSERDPQGRAFVPLAEAHRRLGDLAKALSLIEEGLEAHPDFASAHMVAGWVHRSRQEPHHAMRSFERVLELDAANSLARAAIAELIDDQRAQAYRDKMARKGAVATAEDERPVLPIASLAPTPPEASAAPAAEPAPVSDDATVQLVPIASLAPEEAPRAVVPIASLAPDAPSPTAAGHAAPQHDAGRSVVSVLSLAPDSDEGALSLGEDDGAPDFAGDTTGTATPASGEIHTQTLAELYASQGAADKAIEVYQKLIAKDPDNEALQRRLAELQSLESGSPGAPAQRETVPIESLAPDAGPGDDTPDDPFPWMNRL